jgi:hypothetical protein
VEIQTYRAIWLVNRIIACSNVFDIIGGLLGEDNGGPTATHLQNAFYYLLEEVCSNNPDDCVFLDDEEIIFEYFPQDELTCLTTSSGFRLELRKNPDDVDGQEMKFVSSQEEFITAKTISSSLMDSIRKVLPDEYVHDFMLEELPNKRNNFLMDPETSTASGRINILSTGEVISFNASLDDEETSWNVILGDKKVE